MDFYPCLVFDIDGTLTRVGDRLRCLENHDWDQFYARCGEDEPNEPVMGVFRSLVLTHPVLLLTGRRESTRATTLAWFARHGVLVRSEQLLMRVDGDKRPDTVVKPELLARSGITPAAFFEDRKCMVDCWRAQGFTCFHVSPGEF